MKPEVIAVLPESELWQKLEEYARECSWIAGPHLAQMLREKRFKGWETPFAAVKNGEIIGYCTVMETDYYPENRYLPWISSIFVGEEQRGKGVCGLLIRAAEQYLARKGFREAYIPSDMEGFYERYGYEKIDRLVNYGGDTDNVFMRKI